MKDLRSYVARKVIVNTETDVVEGTVEKATADSVTLHQAALLSDEGGRRPVDGVLVIPANRVTFVQVL